MNIPAIARPALGALAALLLAAAPSGAGFTDPTGDTFGPGPVQVDITSYDATYSGGSTTFTIHFAGPISAASAAVADSLYGFIDLDLDKDAKTGGTASFPGVTSPIAGGNNWINYYIAQGAIGGPTVALGDEAFVDLGSEANHAGSVDVLDATTGAVLASVAIAYTSHSVSLTIPLVGSVGSPSIAFDLLVGTSLELTDRATNGGVADLSTPSTTPAVPEPSSLALLTLGGLALGLGRADRLIAGARPARAPCPGR